MSDTYEKMARELCGGLGVDHENEHELCNHCAPIAAALRKVASEENRACEELAHPGRRGAYQMAVQTAAGIRDAIAARRKEWER